MIKCLIFDLSEVLINGILGVERELSKHLGVSEEKILKAFSGDNLVQLCLGKISENDYLNKIISKEKWLISQTELKQYLRNNFLTPIAGMPQLVCEFSDKFELILLSDHCREWIEFIEAEHGFLKHFRQRYYSFLNKKLKSDPETFGSILKKTGLTRQEVVFIDDNPQNAEAAEKAGIRSIVFQNKQQLLKLLNTEK